MRCKKFRPRFGSIPSCETQALSDHRIPTAFCRTSSYLQRTRHVQNDNTHNNYKIYGKISDAPGTLCSGAVVTLSVQTSFACLVLGDLVQGVLSAVLVLAVCPLSLRNVHLHAGINSLLRNRPERLLHSIAEANVLQSHHLEPPLRPLARCSCKVKPVLLTTQPSSGHSSKGFLLNVKP